MIDFRYHIVSLVSVFVALAVGLVLGAGPLKAPISDGLDEQVKVLAADRATLRDSLAASEASVQRRDTFIESLAPRVVAKALTGRTIAVVLLPGVEPEDAAGTIAELKAAGGVVTETIAVNSSWVDPAQAEFRAQITAQLLASVPVPRRPAAGTSALPGLLGLGAMRTAKTVAVNDPVAVGVLAALAKAKLVTVTGDFTKGASAAVVVAPAGTLVKPGGPTQTTAPKESDLKAMAAITAALDSHDDGTVVTGPASSASDGLLGLLREDSGLAKGVSTVDTGSTGIGPILTVLALQHQLTGGTGNFGFAAGADTVTPLVRN